MRLKKIIDNLDVVEIRNFKNYNITSVTHVSKDVVSSSIFLCIKGNNFDGNEFASEAIKKGAKCIITEDKNLDIKDSCIVVVKDIRIAMSVVAKNFYNNCVDNMRIVGIVGTSGKTSTSLILSQVLKFSGKNIGVIGTNGIYIDNIRLDNKFTTPDPLELHYVFYQMKMLGVEIVVMEVSAQAIYYNKIYGIEFDVCVFTNISREHLDFFGSMESYVKVKMNFFNRNNMKESVVNIDDFYGRELAYKLNFPCISYGLQEPANSFAIDIKYELDKTTFIANIIDEVYKLNVPFVGEYNVYNILASITVAQLLGMNKNLIESALANMNIIDGRFNVYKINNRTIIIDFAHTPDSIDKLLSHIKQYAQSKIISVFGCVGYSDKDKREEMALSVSKYSDMIVVTTDNPGNASFSDICDDIIVGLKDKSFVCIEDRFTAISYAYKLMHEKDILVLIGKGAEDFQTIGNERVPYSDKESVLKLIKAEG